MIKRHLTQFMLCLGMMVFFSNSTNAQWVQTNGISTQLINTLVVSGGNNVFAGAFGGGVSLTTDNGASWKSVNSGLETTFINSLTTNNSNLFAGTDNGIFLSTNNGTNWEAVNSGIENYYIFSLFANQANIFAGTRKGIFLTTNNGSSWAKANSGLDNVATLDLNAFVASAGNIFAGTNRGIFLSTDNGTSWSLSDSSLSFTSINTFAANGGNIFAGTVSSGILLSTNNGTSWKAVNSGLDSRIAKGLSIMALTVVGNKLFAGTTQGVFLSTNNGSSWTDVSSGLFKKDMTALAICGDYLFAGTNGRGVWRRPLSEMKTGVIGQHVQRESTLREHLKIGRSGSFLTIEFSIPHSNRVTISAYDISGNKVSSLVDSRLDAGSYSRGWDIRTLARGCYTLRMQSGKIDCMRVVEILR